MAQSQKRQALPAQLTWSHYIELLNLDEYNETNYYIDISIKEKLGYRQLHKKTKSKEYQRLDNKTIGIIVCKKDDRYLIEYSSDERIKITTYELV